MLKPRIVTLTAMILAAALSRLIPHPWNFTPVAAMALFGGANFSDKRLAFLVPFAALFLSDAILGFYPGWMMVYAAFGVIVLMGTALKQRRSASLVAGMTLMSSLTFFVLTNFGHWLVSNMYPHNSMGLIQSYTAAIPFFRNTLLGDAFFSAVLFAGFSLAERRFPALQEPALSPVH